MIGGRYQMIGDMWDNRREISDDWRDMWDDMREI